MSLCIFYAYLTVFEYFHEDSGKGKKITADSPQQIFQEAG